VFGSQAWLASLGVARDPNADAPSQVFAGRVKRRNPETDGSRMRGFGSTALASRVAARQRLLVWLTPQIMFADEARFGRMNRPRLCWSPIGIRPEVAAQLVHEFVYLYGAVSPKEGTCVYLIAFTHLFRDAAATTMSIADPAHVQVAATLLGHRTFATTERHYRQSLAQMSHRAFVDVLFGLKSGGPDER
jgi:integrase